MTGSRKFLIISLVIGFLAFVFAPTKTGVVQSANDGQSKSQQNDDEPMPYALRDLGRGQTAKSTTNNCQISKAAIWCS
jgi:hypothetical protein